MKLKVLKFPEIGKIKFILAASGDVNHDGKCSGFVRIKRAELTAPSVTNSANLAPPIQFSSESCRLITVETFHYRIMSAPTCFHLAAVSSSVAQRSNAHALRERLPALEVLSGRVAADGGVGHRVSGD